MDKPLLRVALVGRPNVGKSTLFNRLAGKRLAIVHETAGATRDFKIARGQLFDLPLSIVDTAGFDDAPTGHLDARLWAQTKLAISMADVVLFLVSAKDGLTPLDTALANKLRTHLSGRPLIVCVNKAENQDDAHVVHDCYGLGFDTVIAIAAAHGIGLHDIYDSLQSLTYTTSLPASHHTKPDFHLAIVGRPNVGKSTIVNGLLGENRMLTGDEAGLTRDSISIPLQYKNHHLNLIDTAGLRKRSATLMPLDKLAMNDTNRTISYAHVVALVLDATAGFDKQDITLARHIVTEGRALLLVLNKWDAVLDKPLVLQTIQDTLTRSFHQIKHVPILSVSALYSPSALGRILHESLTLYDTWKQRISTARLNDFLASTLAHHPPPMVRGVKIKLKYMTQVKSRPPTFMFFGTRVSELPESYSRYLHNAICHAFAMENIPVRLLFKASDNPYDAKK